MDGWRKWFLSLAVAASCIWCVSTVQKVYSQEQAGSNRQQSHLKAQRAVSTDMGPAPQAAPVSKASERQSGIGSIG